MAEKNTTFILEASISNENSAKMSLTILPKLIKSFDDYCRNIENLCFWSSASYKIAENNVESNQTIGTLGPDFNEKLCPKVNIKYVLLNGK